MTTLRQLALLVVLAAVLAGASVAWHREFPVWTDNRAITYAEAAALGASALWIDARSAEHYRLGHAPGALNLTERAWDAGIEHVLTAWQPGQIIVIYCDSGGCRTGHHVAAHLERDLGVRPRVLIGGWDSVRKHRSDAP